MITKRFIQRVIEERSVYTKNWWYKAMRQKKSPDGWLIVRYRCDKNGNPISPPDTVCEVDMVALEVLPY